jgi:hypothetical protein
MTEKDSKTPTPSVNYSEFIATAGEQYLETVAKVQDSTVEALSKWAKAARELPAGSVVGSEAAPEVSAREIVSASFDFVTKALAQQKAYATRVLDLTEQAS